MTIAATSRELRAGGLSCCLDATSLVHISWNGVPVVRMIYGAVRDSNWGTIEPIIKGLSVTEAIDGFDVRFDAHYHADDLFFVCHYHFAGTANGELTTEIDGRAETAFDYARIGLCTLLPWQAYCGKPFKAALRQRQFAGTIPTEIAKQLYIEGCYTPSIPPFTHFKASPVDGISVCFEFDGDEFEMEDQRNWTDSTLKIYSTPLHLGNLHHASVGSRIFQSQRVIITGKARAAKPASKYSTVSLEIGVPTDFTVPPIGTTWPRSALAETFTADTFALSHLRFEVNLTNAAEVGTIDKRLPSAPDVELAVFTDEKNLPRLTELLRNIDKRHEISRVIVNDLNADVTDPHLIKSAKKQIVEAGYSTLVGGGTDFWFAEINRASFDFSEQDFLSLSATPQLHVFDDESILESSIAQGLVVDATRNRTSTHRVALSPVTLIPRDSLKVLNHDVYPTDPRHETDFLTAWTASSLISTMSAGVHSLTYFDFLGLNGLMRLGGGGATFLPTYHLLAALTKLVHKSTCQVSTTETGSIRAIAIGFPDTALLIVNATPRPRTIQLAEPSLTQREYTKCSYLLRHNGKPSITQTGQNPLLLELAAYEVVLLKWSRTV